MIEMSLFITAIFLFLGALGGFGRLIVGPYLADRVISLDYLSIVAIATICLLSIYFKEALYLDVAIMLALLSFLATIAFARYSERRKSQGAGLEELDD